jgi:Concanavalin A-like lectin/glucanases superfamily
VYNATAQTMTLYVNGTAVGSASRTAAPWNAFNEFSIGAAIFTPIGGETHYTDRWNGTIDTVYAYAGAVPASSISRIP